MFEKMMAGSRKLSFSFLAAAFAATVFVGFAPSQASAMMSVERERELAQKQLEKDQMEYNMVQPAPDSQLRRMEDEFVKYNSDRLNYDDGAHDRWLDPVWLYKGARMSSWSYGGYIVVSNHDVSSANLSKAADGTIEYRDNNPRDIYNNSKVAVSMAHELAHFANNDLRKGNSLKGKSIECEKNADRVQMELLSNVPEYSMGSRIENDRFLTGDGYDGTKGFKSHPSDHERYLARLAFIKEYSNGRVELDDDMRLTVDGKLFMGTGKLDASVDAASSERTTYLAGQIASCIHDGIWKRANIAHASESVFFDGGRPEKTTLAVFRDSSLDGEPVKILGTFDVDPRKSKVERSKDEQSEADTVNAILALAEK